MSDLITQAGAIAVAITAIIAMPWAVWKYVGTPMIKTARKAVAFIRKLDDAANVVNQELKFNGGASLKDSVAQIRRSIAVQDALMHALTTCIGQGTWDSDHTGKMTNVSACLCRMVGRPADDFLGMKWDRVVHSDDLPEVQASWEAAIAARVQWSRDFRLVTAERRAVRVRSVADPVLESSVLVGYKGAVIQLEPAG